MERLNASIRDIEIPPRMRHLPLSPTGYPVPWFVGWLDGLPDFRTLDARKLARATAARLCWLCGQTLGRFESFVIGPMCAVNRVSAEPPCHLDCAQYAVVACPFLTKPRMRRNEKDMPDEATKPAGLMIRRNPGVVLIWTTKSHKLLRASGGMLFAVGPPEHLTFYAEGRPATRDEIFASVDSGLPLLLDEAQKQGRDAVAAFERQVAAAMKLIDEATAA